MAWPIHIEFPEGMSSQGDSLEAIFLTEADRVLFLVGQVIDRLQGHLFARFS